MQRLYVLLLSSFFFSPLLLSAYQDCKLTILVDPVSKNFRARDISKDGNDVAKYGGSATGGSYNSDTLQLDVPLDINTVTLDLSPEYKKNSVWECSFQNSVNKNNIVVNYSLVATNGQGGGVSNGNAFIPVTVQNDRLRFRRRRKVVRGDIRFIFDLSASTAVRAGNYTGVLTIEVHEN